MKLVSVEEMRAIEQEADANGLTYAKMMENAGLGLADEIDALAYSMDEEREVLGLVGPGNNGGDTLVALEHLAANGWVVRAYLVRRNPAGDALVERLKARGGEILLSDDDSGFESLAAFVESADVVVDGLLGTGFKLPLKPEMGRVMDAVNQAIADLPWPPYVVAVDCPSGVDCDSGLAADETIPASLTVCMAAVKQGLLHLPAFELAGELRVAEIGLANEPAWAKVQRQVADDELVADALPVRAADAHKGTFGTAMIVAGSVSYVGAAMLAGKAAYRSGAGLVQMAVPGPVQASLAGHFLEATWVLLPHETGVIAEPAADVLAKNLERATALLVGPGLGTEDTTRAFLENVLKGKVNAKKATSRIGFVQQDAEKKDAQAVTLPPFVVDADGLRHLARIDDWFKLLPADSVLTPHPGETAVLTGLEKDAVQADRNTLALKYAAEWGHVVVLKGAFTVIAAPDGRSTVIPVATPALARAGTGDVLAGLVVGLRAQGVPAYEAAVAAAWIHAQAGLYAAEQLGTEASVMAGDVLDAVPAILSGF